ncbi:FAD-dependent oxidoreductase [Roseovarius salinarum]|uniref:FAD-dependent oxidoreductase n=1 Tax=Roseovarius salinarum TaxID=1981892 RepID=UPI000C347A89|nr:FAD-dependent oxidoreductase [Roseovarius salinarum]
MTVAPPPAEGFELGVETLIVGSGACGMVAALAAAEAGQEVLVLERDPVPAGSTALSAGLIPAAGTAQQAAAGIEDRPALFAADIQRKAKGEADPGLVAALTGAAPDTVAWLTDELGLPLTLVTDFDYPGHSRRRMHGLPDRSGAALVDRLRQLCEDRGIPIVCERHVHTLCADSDRVAGVVARRPDGTDEPIGCGRLILACNGYGGNPVRVAREMPQIAGALYFGHAGNRGEALEWAEALGLEIAHLGAYQGHGNVAHPHGILITWAVITEGGVQLNAEGRRFWDESQGYSEAARAVLAQPGGTAVTIFDERISGIAAQFADFRAAEAQGAIRRADTPEALADAFGLPPSTVTETLAAAETARAAGAPDAYGRRFTGDEPLAPPYWGVRVTGALFHTQGGIAIDGQGRARRRAGGVMPNLFAAGGAAVGVSGSGDFGYLSGNGLLSAVVMGHIVGRAESE